MVVDPFARSATPWMRSITSFAACRNFICAKHNIVLCPQTDNDVLALLEMMLTFGQMMLCPTDTNEKIQADWLGFFGADYGARTRHLDLGKVALYQMS